MQQLWYLVPDVSFPQDGPNSGSDIARIGADSFNLAQIGTYQVLFQVGVTEAGQLELTLNGAPLAYTVVGRATGTSQIIGLAILTTTTINSVLTVRNPADNSTVLTITPLAGGDSAGFCTSCDNPNPINFKNALKWN